MKRAKVQIKRTIRQLMVLVRAFEVTQDPMLLSWIAATADKQRRLIQALKDGDKSRG